MVVWYGLGRVCPLWTILRPTTHGIGYGAWGVLPSVGWERVVDTFSQTHPHTPRIFDPGLLQVFDYAYVDFLTVGIEHITPLIVMTPTTTHIATNRVFSVLG